MFCLGLVLAAVLAGCAPQQKAAEGPMKPNDISAQDVTQQVETFTLSSVGDDGASNWQLEGASADITDDRIDLKNVRIESQAAGGSLTMKAKKGTIKKNADMGVFKEDVVLVYDDGTTLTTDTVDWFFKKQTARTEAPVFVKTGGLETKAKGACLMKGTNQIRLDKEVSMNTASGTKIKCAGPLIIDYKKNAAVFNDKVSIESPKAKMTSRRMVVFFDPQKKKVRRVEATGKVCLIRGNSISASDKAVYFCEEGKAILTGNPTVYVDTEEARVIARSEAP